MPKPGPVPTPAAVRKVAHAQPAALTVAAPPGPPSETFGRVAEDGTVFVRTGDGEREVGAYPGATPEEALHYFARKYDELYASADLLHQRLTTTDLSAKDAAEGLAKLREHCAEANVVGDLAGLDAKVAEIEALVAARKEAEAAERSAARAAAAVEREAIVAEAEKIAGQPESKIQWKSSGARMRELLDEWKKHQRDGARLDRETEGALWQRFSQARNSFDKARRVHFAQLEGTQAEAKAAKQELVKEAEALVDQHRLGPDRRRLQAADGPLAPGRPGLARPTTTPCGSGSRPPRTPSSPPRTRSRPRRTRSSAATSPSRRSCSRRPRPSCPSRTSRPPRRPCARIQDKWDAAGKVPRGDVDRMEKGMRRIEQAVRDADDQRWKQSNPEVAARAQSMVDQLEASVASLEDDLAKAQASGNEKKVKDAQAKLEAQEQWLAQARGNLDEFGG